jgi:hypothetical protein
VYLTQDEMGPIVSYDTSKLGQALGGIYAACGSRQFMRGFRVHYDVITATTSNYGTNSQSHEMQMTYFVKCSQHHGMVRLGKDSIPNKRTLSKI